MNATTDNTPMIDPATAAAKRRSRDRDSEHSEFLMIAQVGLVLRGYNRERDIHDPILRKVWRFGRRLNKERMLKEKRQ